MYRKRKGDFKMKIDNGMIVRVINLPTNKRHFGHLNDIGIVTDKRNNQFCIKFEDECCGFWSLDEVEIIDRNKQERINRRLKQIESLKKNIIDIINE